VGARLRWIATHDLDYLEPAEWENGGNLEASLHARSEEARGPWLVRAEMAVGGGVEYRGRGDGAETADRYDVQPYVRLAGSASAARSLGRRSSLLIRAFGGVVEADAVPLRQRWFSLAGADPVERIRNPFVRSRGALLTEELPFHEPGGGNVRGLSPAVGVTRVLAVNLELERSVAGSGRRLFRDVRIAGFADGAWSDGFFSRRGRTALTGDAGLGIRIAHRIGATAFVTRFDLPLFVAHPDRAIRATGRRLGLRWVIGVEPVR
jgi:hypothetical protein